MPPRVSIPAGTRFGPYEIGVSLGAGGMGEVYRAQDTRLDRAVAIKVLAASLAQNAQFRLRFDREARTISQLNHPHICTLHDIGAENGISFLVMELVAGESLADIVARGPLPPGDVLKYGAQIAEAMAAAHRAGVVHRDLKPANVMITKSGAKLLDFGLAKGSVVEISVDDATQHKPITQEGTILGTFQYMAPEQIEGQDADPRSDIFALGAVLYEMATGQRAFSGKTRTSLIAAIVKEQPPPLSSLQPLAPHTLQHVVDRCLAKDPDERWQSALDVATELRWIGSSSSQAGAAEPVARARRRRVPLALAVAGWLLALTASGAAFAAWSRARTASRITRLEIAQPLDESFNQPLALSPDGRRVAMLVPGVPPRIAIRDLDGGTTKLLNGTEGAFYPFWAPDGHAVAFFVTGLLKVVDLDTGAVQTICKAIDGRGGSWGRDGVIVFAPDFASAIFKVSENGGVPTAITKTSADSYSHRNPTFLPDGKHFLYCVVPVHNNVDNTSVRIGSIDEPVDRLVLPHASNVAYVDGWLLFARDRNLVAQPFDLGSRSVEGKPVSLAQNVDWYVGRWLATFAAAGDTLVYRTSPNPRRQLLVLDPNATVAQPAGEPAAYSLPDVSPDGRKVLVNRGDPTAGGSDLWMLDLAGGNPVRLTFQAMGTMDDTARFSPDGQHIAMASSDTQGFVRAWVQPAGGGTKQMLRSESERDFVLVTDWTPDGQAVITVAQRPGRNQDIERIAVDGSRKPVPVVHETATEGFPRISPNGRWMAYQSDASGRFEIYVTGFPDGNAKWQVSTTGGTMPGWSADGKTLYYLAGRKIVGSAVHEGAAFSSDPPEPVPGVGDSITGFAVGRNGRIVAVRELDAGEPPLTVVLHWRSLLKK